ncbi:uncharacterized protein [Montipora foliosa]|uniref:uncharacterized protein n=1 Tax=Montipora foliosa TaxID=591990 RepID=UPI0035F15F31
MNRLLTPDGNVLPASEGTLIYFASYLARTVRHSTIKLYLTAVRNLLITAGYNDPLKGKLLLCKVLRGILRYQGYQRIRRLPVTPQIRLAIRPVLHAWLRPRDFSMIYLLRDSTRVAGFPYKSLKGHSFRIGAASVAAAAGLPDWLIKVLGRWSSDCYQLYIRTPQSTLESVAPRMAAVSGGFSPV